jgi:hypothetical protein
MLEQIVSQQKGETRALGELSKTPSSTPKKQVILRVNSDKVIPEQVKTRGLWIYFVYKLFRLK